MSVFRSDDPVQDFNRHEAEQEAWLEKRPECADCGEHIQNEEAYYINGEWICESCMDSYRREVLSE